MKPFPATKLALLYTVLVGASLMLSDRADALSIREAYKLNASSHSDGLSYINNLIGMAPRSEGVNGQYFGSNASTPHTFVIDRALASREVITVPTPGGLPKPGNGAGVPDGGITAMLLGVGLSALGIARRYLRI